MGTERPAEVGLFEDRLGPMVVVGFDLHGTAGLVDPRSRGRAGEVDALSGYLPAGSAPATDDLANARWSVEANDATERPVQQTRDLLSDCAEHFARLHTGGHECRDLPQRILRGEPLGRLVALALYRCLQTFAILDQRVQPVDEFNHSHTEDRRDHDQETARAPTARRVVRPSDRHDRDEQHDRSPGDCERELAAAASQRGPDDRQ